ncbi:MAG: hypothetical protein CBC49_007050 [Alphaproteobacteria bacterium TMED89]|nr:hypothetical protein [Rhodospirillaceae bacterium]RPH13177.1 MAG: hypothetical protein CBC49_007050 [Alphaproteobacteria bacterium TMED89]
MTVVVIAEAQFTEQGAQDFIEWSKGDDGYVITRDFDGFEHIETWLAEDNKTILLYELWSSKEKHQAYLKFRTDGGLMDFLGPRLEGEFTVTYLAGAD